MNKLIRAFIIMQETLLKIDRDPETIIAVSVASVQLSVSSVILSTLQRAEWRKKSSRL